MADPLRPWDFVFQSSGATNTNVTAAANNATANDFLLTNTENDIGGTAAGAYFCMRQPFPELLVNVGTARVGGTGVVWEYYFGPNGTDWAALQEVRDNTQGFSIAGTNRVSFRQPFNWFRRKLFTVPEFANDHYIVRARTTGTPSTNALGTQAWAIFGFPRFVRPASVTPFRTPGPLTARGQTGKDQIRSILALGREWDETWSMIQLGDSRVDEFLSTIEDYYNNGTVFAIEHLTTRGSGLAPGGAATGNPIPRINGASQAGNFIATDGWSISQPLILDAGDVIRIDGLSPLYRVTARAGTFAGGSTNISIAPSIPVGSSPLDNAPIQTFANTLRAYIAAPPNIPACNNSQYIDGLTLTFREAI